VTDRGERLSSRGATRHAPICAGIAFETASYSAGPMVRIRFPPAVSQQRTQGAAASFIVNGGGQSEWQEKRDLDQTSGSAVDLLADRVGVTA
jgi:hypothetical protein